MKANRVSKSDVMKKAWTIYKKTSYNSFITDSKRRFASCLERAWQAEKENVIYRAKQAEEKEREERNKDLPRNNSLNMVALAGSLLNYYSNNRYNGD